MKITLKYGWTALLALAAAGGAALAQPAKERSLLPAERTAGVYYSYEEPRAALTPAPEGYEPVYISHYGRHGSRWHTSDRMYRETAELFAAARQAGALTAAGESAAARLQVIAEDAAGHAGDLSPRGVREHRGIAERMVYNFPEVFASENGKPRRITARSTLVPRCILSMAANNERLKELRPELRIEREASAKYMYYLGPEEEMSAVAKESLPIMDSLRKTRIHPARLIGSLFRDESFVRERITDSLQFMVDMYMLASIMQNNEYLNISLYDLFLPEELFDIWEYYNYRMYVNNGPSPAFRDRVLGSMKPLLANIVESADAALAGGDTAADLRFGHDVFITPLAGLMALDDFGVQETDPDSLYRKWRNFELSPMAANLQLIFYREKPRAGGREAAGAPDADRVLVKILYNEKEMKLPLASALAPYYRWSEVKKYFECLCI